MKTDRLSKSNVQGRRRFSLQMREIRSTGSDEAEMDTYSLASDENSGNWGGFFFPLGHSITTRIFLSHKKNNSLIFYANKRDCSR